MESILVHPENAEQLKAVKAFLKTINVQFEPQKNSFPPRIAKSIKRSIGQYESGETISFKEFKEKHFSKK